MTHPKTHRYACLACLAAALVLTQCIFDLLPPDVSPAPGPGGTLQFTTAAYSVAEGDAKIRIRVTRASGASGEATVAYATADGTALAGADYTATSGTLTWADGDAAEKHFDVPIADDAALEGDETFTVKLSGAAGADLGSPAESTVLIASSDTGASTLQFTAAVYSVSEGDTKARIRVTRVGDASGEASVAYATSDGTAAAGADYTASSGTLSWADGDAAEKHFDVPVANDSDPEDDETFIVNLSGAAGAELGGPSETTVQIALNDMSLVQFKSATCAVGEAQQAIQIYVSRTGDAFGVATVAYATTDGTATAGADYTATSGTLSWADGDVEDKYFDVPITNDADPEGGETFTVALSGPAGTYLGNSSEMMITIQEVVIETVPVGYPGNQEDTRPGAPHWGAVPYTFEIGKYEVTAGQYTAFLNVVAKTDTYGLFAVCSCYPPMLRCCGIQRDGTPGNYTYSVPEDWANRPVYCKWGDAARYANWLHNGQPAGDQDLSTTEDGAYYLNGAITNEQFAAVTRKPNARWVLPTQDEWYKAAYFDPAKPGGVGYWDYPTRSNVMPSSALDPAGTNNANYAYCDWEEEGPCQALVVGPPYYRSEVGAFAGSPGPFGTFDQAGNVAEYTEEGMGCGWCYEIPDDYLGWAHPMSYDSACLYADQTGFRVCKLPVADPLSRGTVQIKAPPPSPVEHDARVRIHVIRADGAYGAATVEYTTRDGTALAGLDYTATSGTLSWTDGDTTDKHFEVPITDDALQEDDGETFNVMLRSASGASLGLPTRLTVRILDDDVNIETVTVGDPGNPADTRYATPGYGAVNYTYQIGTYEVTVRQYAAYLNAIAQTDTHKLFPEDHMDPYHGRSAGGDIQRAGEPGSYTYSVDPKWADRPITYMEWRSAARFANWLHNGQPAGAQDLSTTEDGAYYIKNVSSSSQEAATITRKPDAIWAIPTEDEWYKAAYYDPAKPGGAGYWDYPTRSDLLPSNVFDPAGTNHANFENQNRYTIGAPYFRTEVGAFAGSPSAYGTFDQGGNANEWNETWIEGCWRLRGGGIWLDWSFEHSPSAGLRASDRGCQGQEGGTTGFRVCRLAPVDPNHRSGTLQFKSATYVVAEADGSIRIRVTRTDGSFGSGSIQYAVTDGTATAGSDYAVASGTLAWADGDTADKDFTVGIIDDSLAEEDETFTLRLSGARGAYLGSLSQATVKIPVNDKSRVRFKSVTGAVAENALSIRIYVNRTIASGSQDSVEYATVDGTAVAGSDYTATSGTLSWADGDGAEKYFDVPLAGEDGVPGVDKTFSVVLSEPTGMVLDSPSQMMVRILDTDVLVQTVAVGNPGNAPDPRYGTPGYGAVAYSYAIGKYEITAAQYTVFLNAVAQTDTYELYDHAMAELYDPSEPFGPAGCNILRTGQAGSYTYTVAADWAHRPVNYVSWGDAARFANWLHNGQPAGAQDMSTTEDGSYDLNGAMTNEQLMAVTRKPTATWVIPTEDEWYKAAYHDLAEPTGEGYWEFATRAIAYPKALLDPSGTNNANFYECFAESDACPIDPDAVPAPPPYNRTEVGAFAGSPSAYGTFDQAGNIAEWNESASDDCLCRGVRGGAYLVWDPAIWPAEEMGARYRTRTYPASGASRYGFRVVKLP